MAILVAMNANESMVAPFLECGRVWSLESGGLFCVSAKFQCLNWFVKCIINFFTFNVICKDNVAYVQHGKVHFRQI
jgi:hypothetical protein